ncbi:hypothetical protein GLOTRDRAFT_135806 [Gloeophyllum trabeum ATCC 11539]|uniref:Uncharacterized protein n=1 Tax=Gloeophyllum trabeum (strain ATCC 11539 / FP-39264 / Madison 617) TaxID=670483 RepID=S7QP08_GLOTA|nr:uncharacterized protein GLOTRDRAFT_135806 [Gloeophyllum trabeum ATCC 11539]EPQ61311.1 hypothetical protein GLOTRDRAFT_135806 [Gloeophyllum trabeum ATCC 11539]
MTGISPHLGHLVRTTSTVTARPPPSPIALGTIWSSCFKRTLSNDTTRHSDAPAITTPGCPSYAGKGLNLRTLDPSRLSSADYIDISGKHSILTRIWANPLPPFDKKHSIEYLVTRRPEDPPTFPAGTRGFLYWYKEADAPPLAADVRFRLVKSPHVRDFSSGDDLRQPDGNVWRISMFRIARYERYSTLRTLLLSERLITQDMLDLAAQASGSNGRRVARPRSSSQLVWKFGQPFPVRLRKDAKIVLWIVGRSAVRRFRLQHIDVQEQIQDVDEGSPFMTNPRDTLTYFSSGKCFVQFERSALPPHEGTRTVVLRVVKTCESTLSSVTVPQPQEGELVYTRNRQKIRVPWSVNVDEIKGKNQQYPTRMALKLLFENEQIPPTGVGP